MVAISGARCDYIACRSRILFVKTTPGAGVGCGGSFFSFCFSPDPCALPLIRGIIHDDLGTLSLSFELFSDIFAILQMIRPI